MCVTLQKDNDGLSEVEDIRVTAVLGIGGTATLDQDFTFSSQNVTFQPSDQIKTVTFNILNDDIAGEGVESFTLSLERDSSLRLLEPQFPTTEVFIEDDGRHMHCYKHKNTAQLAAVPGTQGSPSKTALLLFVP